MADFTRVWDSSDKEYTFYDGTTTYGHFTGLTGGDMKISMIPYNTIGENGGVVTKYLPGQISYAPIKLAGSMSGVMKELTDWFYLSVNGNFEDLRRNCSIAQFKNATPVELLVIWDLINVVPIALPGFSYNSYQKTASTSFKVLLQAEEINIIYP